MYSLHNNHSAISPALLTRVEEFSASTILSLPAGFTYHSLEHTKLVVENARALATATSLSDFETGLLLMAAWLHDVGFHHTYLGHEKESCNAARKLLTDELEEEAIAVVESAIHSTEIPQGATSRVAEVLCDADLLYLAGEHFFVWSGRLREEHLQILARQYSELEWLEFNISFIVKHHFYTSFARQRFGEGVQKNLRKLEEKKLAIYALS